MGRAVGEDDVVGETVGAKDASVWGADPPADGAGEREAEEVVASVATVEFVDESLSLGGLGRRVSGGRVDQGETST